MSVIRPPSDRPTLARLAAALASGAVTSRQLVEQCLARIRDPQGEGARAFISVAAEAALRTADAMDALRAAGAAPSPWAGIPFATKDLFDVRGEVTAAGSRVLAGGPPAQKDAVAVARLRAAGFIHIGRANMTEFAYSGLGMNPHYGSPRAPWRREEGRVSGGSTSGGAVAVAEGMAFAALGTDTGGSCRIPAAFCGIAGFKPTARFSAFDAVAFPTVAILPPRIADLGEAPQPDGDGAYAQANLLALRNATLVNVIDGCAISLPVGPADGPPVGLTLAGAAGADRRILAIAVAAERLLAGG